MPDHPAFQGLIVEINATEVVRNLELAKDVARLVFRFHNIAISIDDVGAEWPSFLGLRDFPFVELRVDRQFVAGCGHDRSKQTTCRRIIDLADAMGARTVAKGVETRADFLAARKLGFHYVQGPLFARPMTAHDLHEPCWAVHGRCRSDDRRLKRAAAAGTKKYLPRATANNRPSGSAIRGCATLGIMHNDLRLFRQ